MPHHVGSSVGVGRRAGRSGATAERCGVAAAGARVADVAGAGRPGQGVGSVAGVLSVGAPEPARSETISELACLPSTVTAPTLG